MKKTTKIMLAITVIVVITIVLFLAIPYNEWKKDIPDTTDFYINNCYVEPRKIDNISKNKVASYLSFCIKYWTDKIHDLLNKEVIYDGGELPEVTVLPDRPIRK